MLMPEFGKPGHYNTCNFKVEVKSFAYFARNGNLSTEPSADFKKWMIRHDTILSTAKTPRRKMRPPARSQPHPRRTTRFGRLTRLR